MALHFAVPSLNVHDMPLSNLWQQPAEDSDSASDGLCAAQELASLRRQVKTFRARCASRLSRQKRKLEQEAEDQKYDVIEDFQHTYFRSKVCWTWGTSALGWRATVPYQTSEGRRRAVWLYFKSLVSALNSLFFGRDPGDPEQEQQDKHKIAHVISINVADDTDIKLSSGLFRSTEVRSIFNCIQQHIVVPTGAASLHDAIWFLIHQPLVALSRASTLHVLAEFLSWSLAFCNTVGWRLRALGLQPNLFEHVPWHVFILMGDANKVNDSMSANMSRAVCQQHAREDGKCMVSLQLHCLIHQVCLTRKTLALGFDSYWSTLVRLAHLFESRTFRQKFYAALTKIVRGNFDYFLVQEVPVDVKSWKEAKIRGLKLFSDQSHATVNSMSKRYRLLRKILSKDDGDASQPRFTHFCTGQHCCPGGAEEALGFLVQSYLELFAVMQVPLLYRWKHASIANSFVRDGFFLHAILPRTLELMPTIKCHSFMFEIKYFVMTCSVSVS